MSCNKTQTHQRMRVKISICAAMTAAALFFAAVHGSAKEERSVGMTPAAAQSMRTETLQTVQEPSGLYAKSAVLMDGDSGRVLFSKDGQTVRPNASTTKLMTCILALERGNLEDIVTASDYAASMPQVAVGVKAGEQYYMKDLIYSLMLESHNDSAVIIAEHIAGSTEAFAAMMNEKADEIGCTDTFFVTPNGLDGEAKDSDGTVRAHGTTAEDLALILRYCMTQSPQKDKFCEITTTPFYTFSSLNSGRNVSCYNHNTFLTMMDGAGPGKTGFTGKAGYCYAGSLKSEGRTFIVALLACGWPDNKTYKWQDMKKLMNYAKENYHYTDVYEDFAFSPVPVENGISASGNLSQGAYTMAGLEDSMDRQLNVLLRDDETVNVTKNCEEKLEAPVAAGKKIGEVTYMLGKKVIAQHNIVTLNAVEAIDGPWCFKYVLTKFLSESH